MSFQRQFSKDNWHRQAASTTERDSIRARRWGMRVTVYLGASAGDYVLSYGLASTSLQDNGNWLKVADIGQAWGGGGAATAPKSQAFAYTGVETVFTVNNGTLDKLNFVEVNGVIQRLGTDYTQAGQVVTFGSLPGSGTMVVYYFEGISIGGGGGGGVQSVTGAGVDNTDPENPVLSFPTPAEIGAQQDLGYIPMDPAQNGSDFASPSAALVNLGGALKLTIFNTQAGDYTPQLSDFQNNAEILMVSGSPHNLTIPNDATVNFPVGAVLFGRTIGGVTTFVPGAGVTVTSTSTGMISPANYVLWSLTKTAANTWVLDNGTIVNVANNQLANMANSTIKGRYSAGTGSPEDLTPAQVHEIIFNTAAYYRLYSDFSGGSSEFSTSVSGTGAVISYTNDGGDANHPGVLQLNCGTTTTGFASIRNGAAGTITPTDGKMLINIICKVNVISDGTDTYTLRIGIGTQVNADGSDAAFFRYTHSVNGGRWQTVTRHSSSETAKDAGGSAIVANTYYNLKIVSNAANSSYDFYLNNVLVQTHISDLPLAQVMVIGSITKSAGTTARILGLDMCQIIQEFNTSR